MVSGAFVVHVTEGVALGLGGTAQYVAELCRGLSECGMKVEIWAPHLPWEAPPGTGGGIRVCELPIVGPVSFCWSPGFDRAVEGEGRVPAVIHQHGLWLDPYRRAARYARRHRVPLIVSLHGMLEPWALKRSRWKKRIAWKIFQKEDLQASACLHVATEAEAENVRRLGITTPIAVIPNGIRLPGVDSGEDCREEQNPPRPPFAKGGGASPDSLPSFGEQGGIRATPFGRGEECKGLIALPGLPGRRMVLFLGRLHPVKGLDLLIEVWAKTAGDFPDWHLALAGPDEDGHQGVLASLTERLGVARRVSFVGPVEGESKAALLRGCDFLVLPSHMESFGLVVLEALSYGRPVMVSKGCPWGELETRRCGWWVQRTADDWEKALRNAMGQEREALGEMGRRGRQLVEEKYSRERMVDAMIRLYERVV